MALSYSFDSSRNMDTTRALAAFAALGQTTRLQVFRLLVQAAPDGLAAGDVANRLAVVPNTLSSHLAQLCDAGLITAHRQGRQILYAADLAGLQGLIVWLVQDCCAGRPELCALPAALCAPTPCSC
jgi:ArsR family transcriptional regulator, arsenate/arsenite/antimonite-responsive transcriptional repressor